MNKLSFLEYAAIHTDGLDPDVDVDMVAILVDLPKPEVDTTLAWARWYMTADARFRWMKAQILLEEKPVIDLDDITSRSFRALRDMEWCGHDNSCPYCGCGSGSEIHSKTCELAAILATEADWKAHIARRNEILAQEGTPSTTP